MNVWKKIKDSHQGKFIPYENDPNGQLILLGGYQKRPIIARAALSAWRWWQHHWPMVVGVAWVLVGIIY